MFISYNDPSILQTACPMQSRRSSSVIQFLWRKKTVQNAILYISQPSQFKKIAAWYITIFASCRNFSIDYIGKNKHFVTIYESRNFINLLYYTISIEHVMMFLLSKMCNNISAFISYIEISTKCDTIIKIWFL